MKTAFFTICSWNYLFFARAWAESVREHHPDADIVLVLADRERDDVEAGPLFDRVVPFEALDYAEPWHMAFRYSVLEFNTALKPRAFLKLLGEGYDRVLYFDPDIRLFGALDEVLAPLGQGASSVLTPHATEPNEAGSSPNDFTFLGAGIYNLGFMAVRACEDVRLLLGWWDRRLEKHCVADRLDEGLFVDQKWMDLWPSYCPDVHILRHPGYNVAYWNLDSRALAIAGQGYTVNGAPLKFFHFSGIVPGQLRTLSRHQRRWRVNSSPALERLFGDYQQQLTGTGREKVENIPYGFGAFDDGTPVPEVARKMFQEHDEFPGSPFATFVDYCNEPAPEVTGNPEGVVTRLAYYLWSVRPDLRAEFNLTLPDRQVAFTHWFRKTAEAYAGISGPFIDAVDRRLLAVTNGFRGSRNAVGAVVAWGARTLYVRLLKAGPYLSWLYRLFPPSTRKAVARGLMAAGWSYGRAAAKPANLGEGATLIGYPYAESGVGEALRSLARSLVAAEVSTRVYNFSLHVAERQQDRSIGSLVSAQIDRRTNILCVNADQIEPTMSYLGDRAFTGRYNILRPFWELSTLPARWDPAIARVDEIWAPTRFVAEAFKQRAGVPVFHMPVAVTLPRFQKRSRSHFGLPENTDLFLFAFNLGSFPARKNPFAAIEAFQEAFRGSNADVGLVIKCMGEAPAGDDSLERLHLAADTDRRIQIIHDTLSRGEAAALLDTCDAFVSLHRSEGFGLGIAEAMLLGKPVIATNYSGSTDFLDERTGYPVPYKLVEVRENEYPYLEGGEVWAEPDVQVAARHMRQVVEDPDAAAFIAQAGQDRIRTEFSPDAVGRVAKQRLAELALVA